MFTFKSFFYAAVSALLVAQANAIPSPQTTPAAPVYHCANGVDTCPKGWTCCGPIFDGVGGTCKLLGEGEVCIF